MTIENFLTLGGGTSPPAFPSAIIVGATVAEAIPFKLYFRLTKGVYSNKKRK